MNGKQLMIGAVVFAAGALLVAWSGRAGDLNPPAGPITETMTNLQDLKTSVDAIGMALNVPTPTWDSVWVEGGTSNNNIVNGSGVIHAFLVSGIGTFKLYTNDLLILQMELYSESQLVTLDVAYVNSFGAFTQSNVTATVLYRPDPAP